MALSSEVIVAGSSALAAIAGSVLTYLRFLRHSSGDVDTTDADRLWKEAERIRASLAEELAELRASARESVAEMAALRVEQEQLRGRLARVEQKARDCKEREMALNQRVAELEAAS